MERAEPTASPPPVLVVDAANVVGSRPDGWWADRQGATLMLRDHLSAMVREGLVWPDAGTDSVRVRPEIILVAEGQARGLDSAGGVRVVDAAGEGDDTIVDTVRSLLAENPARPVVVATADRGLRSRVRALGAEVMSARDVRHRSP
ncbi:NTP pyrophosphohydrolase [Cellulosimicrobium funkei]|nr:NTP pyrophosphohydrolase [Cellulosimicrobium funkei]